MAITIDLHNSDVGDLFVSVRDLNRSGSPEILRNQRINEDQRFPLSIQEDGSELGSITWSAVRADDSSKTGHGNVKPRDGEIVDVTTRFG